ncbi:MAG: aminoacyl-tRNA hydrolase, partial [Gammaproteobacteria bacterium]|nr:aminoacyl-tRNA hydrolase [Gammaproteobacteria bacterium]
MGQQIELIVGLGNPGPEHQRTRHNAGFWFADLLARAYGGTFRLENRFHGNAAEVTLDTHRLRLLKPQTFMNDSGRAVVAIASYYKIPLENVLIAYDELDLEPGRAQLKFDGGHGGHNGMRDVVQCVGKAFWRLRLGIGHPGKGRREEVVNYVLRPASSADEEQILDAVNAAIDVLPVLLEQGAERAKTQLHSRGAEARADNKD